MRYIIFKPLVKIPIFLNLKARKIKTNCIHVLEICLNYFLDYLKSISYKPRILTTNILYQTYLIIMNRRLKIYLYKK